MSHRAFNTIVVVWIALIVLACTIVGVKLAPAQEHQHHHPTETITGATAKFYSNWERPDLPGVSCCNRMDCAAVSRVRTRDGKIEAQRESDGQWLTIPREKMEFNRDSPDGRSHMCSMGTTVFCFIAGSGS